jgi:hypothetical protein
VKPGQQWLCVKNALVHEQKLEIEHGAGQQKGHLGRHGHQPLERCGNESIRLGAQIEQYRQAIINTTDKTGTAVKLKKLERSI